MRFELTVNGKRHVVHAPRTAPLLGVLRDQLGLTAAKYGCGRGHCGACTVIAEGRAVASCLMPVAEAASKSIVTLEGLLDGERLHPVQQAFLDEDAMQCGYCTSGMIVSAAALLDQNPAPNRAEIRAALAQNLCRCGVYGRAIRAVESCARSALEDAGEATDAAVSAVPPAGEPPAAADRPPAKSPAPPAAGPRRAGPRPGAGPPRRWPFATENRLEQRLRFEPDGTIVALSGKVEYGQGIRTGFAQLVAEELDVSPERVRVVLGDTDQCPHDFGTFGSMSTRTDGQALREAAAYARQLLLERASSQLGVEAGALRTEGGAVHTPDGRALAYTDLVGEGPLSGAVPKGVPLKPPEAYRVIGRSLPRLEGPDIVTGRARYTVDLHLPNMLLAVVLHPPRAGGRVKRLDDRAARAVPGVVAVRDEGDFVAILAEHRGPALAAAGLVDVEWDAPGPEAGELLDVTMRRDQAIDAAFEGATQTVEATYVAPHVSNAPIGPSAGLADVREDGAVVYTGTQRPFGLRDEVAEMAGLQPSSVRVVAQPTSGSYGRNNIADAAREAARLSLAVGRPVMVGWSRADELAVSPCRPSLRATLKAGLDAAGEVCAWRCEMRTNPHTYGGAVGPEVAAFTAGRNAVPVYRFPAVEVALRVEETAVRTAAFRSLGAAPNTFAIESFVDELAECAGKDPLDFRLRHLDDPRLIRVLEQVAEQSGWAERRPGPGRGFGLACAVYHGTYVAEVAQVSVSRGGVPRLERVWCAVDAGQIVNPEGARNQTEGAIQQAASWTLLEELKVRDGEVTTTSWDTYPIATFLDAPEHIDVLFAFDPGAPFTGVGEPGAVPVAAAIANAVFDACGVRVRELPLRAKAR
jgi:CO/xanthine dehydrogenase Mo-binding subunit/aerobic-type carbon monoxide dehydrogenase small subunit (CoxS/CutS family)